MIDPLSSTAVDLQSVLNTSRSDTVRQLASSTATYGPTDTGRLLSGLRMRLVQLRSAARQLVASDPESPFRTAGSPQGETIPGGVVDVQVAEDGPVVSARRGTSFTVKVKELARAQRTEGTALTTTAASAVTTGTNTFTIALANGRRTDITLTVSHGDTNDDVLEAIATAIEGSDAGVSASVVRDSTAGTSQLVLEAAETGVANAFYLSEVTGNVVAKTGVDTATVTARDAALVLDGVPRLSPTNTLRIDDERVELTLLRVSGAEVQVTVGSDPIPSAVRDMVDRFNDVRGLVGAPGSPVGSQVAEELDDIVSGQADALQQIGIEPGPGHLLTLDADRLAWALADDSATVEQTIGGPLGLATKLEHLLADALSSVTAFNRGGSLGGSQLASGLPGVAVKGTLVDVHS